MPVLDRCHLVVTAFAAVVVAVLVLASQGPASGEAEEVAPFKFGEVVDPADPTDPFLRPNETETACFYVTNRGTVNDSYDISLNNTNPTWYVALDCLAIEGLPPNGTFRFNLTVIPPEGALPGNHTGVNVSVTSRASNRTLSQVRDWWFVMLRDVELVYRGREHLNLSDDLEGRWVIEVRNEGDYPTVYEIKVSVFRGEVELGHSFRLQVSSPRVTLAPDQAVAIVVTLWIEDTQAFTIWESYHLLVWAIDTDDRQVWDDQRLGWQVPLVYRSSVEPSHVNVTLPPGGTTVVTVNVTQWTTDHMGYPWTMAVESPSLAWSIDLSGPSMFMVGSSTQSFDLVLGTPGEAMAGDSFTHVVTVSNLRRPSSNRLVTVAVEVREYPKLLVMATRSKVWTTPPSTIDLDVLIENPGNVPQPLEFDMTLTRISGGYEVVDRTRFNTTIDPFDGTVYTYNLKVTEALEAGTYLFALECVDVEGLVHVATVTIYVREVMAMEVEVEPTDMLVFDPNHPPPEVLIKVRNTGNVVIAMHPQVVKEEGTRFADIRTSGLPDGPFELRGRENVTFSVSLSVNLEAPYSKFGEFLVDLGEGVPQNWRFHRFDFTVRGPDLMIGEVDHPRVVTDGQEVTARVTVLNGGDSTAPWTYLGVFGPRGLQEDATAIVPSLAPGERVIVDVTFTASADRETYQLHVDPNDIIVELGEGSNVQDIDLEFRTSKKVYATYFILLFLCAVAIMLVALRLQARARRRRLGWDD